MAVTCLPPDFNNRHSFPYAAVAERPRPIEASCVSSHLDYTDDHSAEEDVDEFISTGAGGYQAPYQPGTSTGSQVILPRAIISIDEVMQRAQM